MRAYIFSDAAITPKALDIIKHAKGLALGEGVEIDLRPVPEDRPLHSGATVLAFGKYRPMGAERVVPAPSVPQILTKADILTRLCNVFTLLAQPPVLPEFTYHVVDEAEAKALLARRDEVFAFDIETSGDIKADLKDPSRIITISINDGETSYVIPEELCPVLYSDVIAFLEGGNGIVTVNGMFDLGYYPDASVPVDAHFDAQIAHYVLFPAAGEHGLKPVTKKYFGFEDWDEETEKYRVKANYEEPWRKEDGSWADAREYSKGSGFERIPREILYYYAGFDTYATWHWYLRMKEMLAADPDAMTAFRHLMRASQMYMEVEAGGYRMDVPYMRDLSAELHTDKIEAEEKLNQIAGREINPRSPQQVKRWFAEMGLPLPSTDEDTMKKVIETAAPYRYEQQPSGSTDLVLAGQQIALLKEQTPEMLARTIGEFAEQLLVCRGIAKNLGTYVDGYRKQLHGDRAYPGFKLTASTTGRIGGAGPSLLTLPRDKWAKRMVLPDEGQVLVGADLSQAELRVMAVESMDPWLIAAFQPGAGDFFDLLLGQAYPDIDWVDLHARVSAHTATEDETNFYNNKRAGMKGVVYGASFNRQVRAIAAALKIPMSEAQQLMDAFIRPGSPFDLWRQDIGERAVSGGEIVTRFGRHFQSELVTKRNRQSVINSATAFTSQSTANDICIMAAYTAKPKLEAIGHRLVSTIHDAIYSSGPQETKDEAGKILTETLAWAGREVYGDVVPFDADWGWGLTMAEI